MNFEISLVIVYALMHFDFDKLFSEKSERVHFDQIGE